jgi:hypothetical protein
LHFEPRRETWAFLRVRERVPYPREQYIRPGKVVAIRMACGREEGNKFEKKRGGQP